LQLCLNIAGGHAARIQGQDFVIKAIQACLPFFDQLRLKRALPVARHFDFDVSLLSLQRFLTVPIAHIAGGIALACMLWIP
jgi:hypothetical protein